jgi:hypothetical protein
MQACGVSCSHVIAPFARTQHAPTVPCAWAECTPTSSDATAVQHNVKKVRSFMMQLLKPLVAPPAWGSCTSKDLSRIRPFAPLRTVARHLPCPHARRATSAATDRTPAKPKQPELPRLPTIFPRLPGRSLAPKPPRSSPGPTSIASRAVGPAPRTGTKPTPKTSAPRRTQPHTPADPQAASHEWSLALAPNSTSGTKRTHPRNHLLDRGLSPIRLGHLQ